MSVARVTGGARAHREGTALVGMGVFVASWAMLFSGLLFAYGLLRARAPHWPPADLPALPRGLPGLATLLLAGSSWLWHLGSQRLRVGRAGAAGRLGPAAALGAGFLLCQAMLWATLSRAGLLPQTGSYASVFYGLTALHALHVAVGLPALAWTAARAVLARGDQADRLALSARLWGIYWHMVGAIWIAIYLALFLL